MFFDVVGGLECSRASFEPSKGTTTRKIEIGNGGATTTPASRAVRIKF
jgi:hypothetical protein